MLPGGRMASRTALALLLTASFALPAQGAEPSMTPALLGLRLPTRGFVDAEGRPAAKPSKVNWARRRAGSLELFVGTAGPEGSGRYWTVVVGTARPEQRQPVRGVVLETSTAGWRTLGNFQNRALPWLEDVNRDGKPEFILWDDFGLGPEGIAHALIARVYRLTSADSLTFDWDQSRAMARAIAKEYRVPSADPILRPLRAAAAESLDAFADGRAGARSP